MPWYIKEPRDMLIVSKLAERGEEYDGKINAWDTSYYENILLETKYQLYPEEIKKYFSLENTVTSA